MHVIRMYDRNYKLLAELENASEVDGGFGVSKSNTLVFKMPMTDPKTNATNFTLGNFVTTESDELEPWDGDLVSAEFDGDFLVCTAYDVVQRLGTRRSEAVKFTEKTAGEVAASILSIANQHVSTGIGAGVVYYGGANFTLEYNYDNLYDRLTELADSAKMEFKVRRQQIGVWTVDFVNKLGRDLTASVLLMYGEDIEGNPTYTKEITHKCNHITAFGKTPDSATGSGDNRPKQPYEDSVDISSNGLYMDTIEFSDISDPNTLYKLAQKEVEKRKRPVRTLELTLNRKRGNWANFTDGDIVAIQLPMYDFSGIVVPLRIMGRDVNYSANTMSIAGTVLDGEEAQLLDMYKNAIYGSASEAQVPQG